MDFEDACVLSLLPGRDEPGSALNPAVATRQTYVPMSPVARYVQCVVEQIPPAETDMEAIMEDLLRCEVRETPVTPEQLQRTLQRMGRDCPAAKTVRDFLPKALRTLNGPDYLLVPSDVLAEALLRERSMAGLKDGWGSSDVPDYAIAYRLLVSSGLHPAVLPKYKPLHEGIRRRVMAAWAAACRTFQWEPVVPPEDDIDDDDET